MKKRSSLTSGSGLLAVIFTMSIVAALVAIIYSSTSNQVNVARREVNRSAAITYGDGVMESLFDQWRNAMINVTTATDRAGGMTNSALTAALALPTSTVLPPPAGVTVLSWSVKAQTPLIASTTDVAGRPTPENGTTWRDRTRLYYLATLTVQYYVPATFRTVTLQRVFVRGGRNLFDNFFFGTQQKTEFHPGPPMYVSGTAYIGGDLFTAHNSLHFTQDVTYTGTHTLGFRPEDSRFGVETPDITTGGSTSGGLDDNWDINNSPHYGAQQKLLDTPLASLDANFLDDPLANDSDSDSNNNNDGFHELIEEQMTVGVPNPDPLQLDSGTSDRLTKSADYRIYVDASNNVTIYKGASASALSSGNSEYVAIKAALTTDTAINDVREGDYVRVVTMDVSLINAALTGTPKIFDNAGGTAGTGGDGLLLYIKDTSAGTTAGNNISTKLVNSATSATTTVTSANSKHRGVKLVKGATLPSMGLTVVTPNIAYIQGDYNTGSTSSTQPASNTTTTYVPPVDNPSPNISGYTRAPSAVVADAVNILSNAWNDGASSHDASSTTINTAIVAGNVPTTTASYSGGIENFSRFHENWSGDYLTIYGALALLFDSEQATGPWGNASYSPPNRRWYYDTLFQDRNPPGFHVARTYERGRWVSR